MASEPLDIRESELAALRAERDALATRADEAERIAEQLADELADVRSRLAQERAHAGEEQLALFQARPEHSEPLLSGDGSDAGVLPMALTGVAVVSAMVALLSWANSGLTAFFTLLTLALTAVLAYFAWQTRVIKVSVEISRGIAYIEAGGSTHRFDLRNEATQLEIRGEPGDARWQVRFLRRAMDPFVVDATMVDPRHFMAQLREWRPEL